MKAKSLTLVLGMLVWCAMTAAPACSADAQFTVGGKPITCTVTDIIAPLFIGPWTSFKLTYEFCNGNFKNYICSNREGGVTCSSTCGPETQACNGSEYTFRNDYNKTFKLPAGTQGAQKYVCEKQFDLMNVTVTPLK